MWKLTLFLYTSLVLVVASQKSQFPFQFPFKNEHDASSVETASGDTVEGDQGATLLAQWESLVLPQWTHHHTTLDLLLEEDPSSYDSQLLVDLPFGPILGEYARPLFLPNRWDRHRYDANVTLAQRQRQWPRAFLGIPYAEPPLAEHRFAKTEPWTRSWSQAFGDRRRILKTQRFGPQCIQSLPFPISVMSEDCLYLNVYAPPVHRLDAWKRQHPDRLMPVMFWVFGGAFAFGNAGVGDANTGNFYNGAYVTSMKDVVIVNFNYRVGPFGFLVTEQVPGNMGINDALVALQWVHSHIHLFGGNKDDITIFGLSSGAYTASMLAVNPNAPPLKRAIIMSSPMSIQPRPHATALLLGQGIMKTLNCADLACLKGKSALAIMASLFRNNQGWLETVIGDPLKWMPVSEPEHFPERALNQVMQPLPAVQERLSKMDVMIGTAHDEISMFTGFTELFGYFKGGTFVFFRGNQTLLSYLKSVLQSTRKPSLNEIAMDAVFARLWPIQQNQSRPLGHYERAYSTLVAQMFQYESNVVVSVLSHYWPKSSSVEDCVDQLIQLMSDYMFRCPSRKFASAVSKWARRTYVYGLSHVPVWSLPLFGEGAHQNRSQVVHASDVPYFWHYYPVFTDHDELISRLYVDYFSAFAHGNVTDTETPLAAYPWSSLKPLWPAFTDEEKWIQNIGTPKNAFRPELNPDGALCDFWDLLRSNRSSSEIYPF